LRQHHAGPAHATTHPAPTHLRRSSLDSTKIRSVAGVLDRRTGLVGTRPYRFHALAKSRWRITACYSS
jgi:hypothetical protein